MRPSKAISILMCLVFVLTVCVPVYAEGITYPAIYYGTVQSTGGTSVPAGTVKAYIEGQLMGSKVFTGGNYEQLVVQGEPAVLNGKVVTFKVVVNGIEYDAVSAPNPVLWQDVMSAGVAYFTVNLTVDTGAPVIDNANLSALALSSGALNPAFSADTTSYTASVGNSVSGISVTPTAADAGATIEVNGMDVASGSASPAITLSVGENTITVLVTAQDNVTTKTYAIVVSRSADQSEAQVSPAEAGDKTAGVGFNLSITGAKDVNGALMDGNKNVTVSSSLESPAQVFNAAVSFTAGAATVPVTLSAAGSHTLAVAIQGVTAQASVPVTVVAQNSSDASLSGLVLSRGALNPAFNSNTTGYTASVGYSVSSVTVTPTAADPNAAILVNGSAVPSGSASGPIALNVGTNPVSVLVTAQDGTTSITYTIAITRIADLSGAMLGTAAGDKTKGVAFDLNINNSKDVDGIALAGNKNVTVASDLDGQVFNGPVSFSAGSATALITLNTIGSHILTATVAGVTPQPTIAVNVVDPQTPSDNAYLSSLAISPGALDQSFAQDKYDYAARVPQGTVSVSLTPTAAGPGATIKVGTDVGKLSPVQSGSQSAPINLKAVHTIIYIRVTSQDGENTKWYTVTVNKVSDPSTASVGLAVSGEKTAGVPFDLSISGAVNTSGSSLSGNINVKVTSNRDDGEVYNGAVSFTAGSAIVPVTLNTVGGHILTAAIAGVTPTPTVYVSVKAAPNCDARLSSLTPSEGTLDKAFNPDVTEYIVHVANTVNSITVTPVAFEPDAVIRVNDEAVPSGQPSSPISIKTVAPNANLVIIEIAVTCPKGTGTMVYTFTVMRQEDQSGAQIALQEPGDKTPGVEFAINISEAKGAAGNSIVGNTNVRVTSNIDGVLYSGATAFTAGAAAVPVTLAAVGEHILTVEITGVTNETDPAYLTVNVAEQEQADQSGAKIALQEPGDKIPGVEFAINISEAKDAAGNSIEGNANVRVASNLEGECFNTASAFTAGAAAVPVTLAAVGEHTLTVEIAGVTNETDPAGLTVKVVAAPLPQSDEVLFSSSAYSVNEGAGNATITVNRSNGSSGTVSVDYATSNGTASAGSDYTATSGTLTFASGVTSLSFNVPVIDDTAKESSETITLTLSNPKDGAKLGALSSATLTIADNDTSSPGGVGGGGGSSPSPLEVDKYDPVKDATGVALDAVVKVTFKQEIKALSLSKVSITDSKGNNRVTGVKAGVDGTTLTLAHDNFSYETTYIVKIEKSTVERKDNSADNSEISWSFTTAKEQPVQYFSDVPPGHWAFEVINSLFEAKIVGGYPDGVFKPENNITRAEFTKMLTNALGIAEVKAGAPTFKDVAPGDWYYGCIEAASKAGLVKGYDTGEFRPNAQITRQEMTVVLVRAMGLASVAAANAGVKTNFADDMDIASWARGFVYSSALNGLVSGYTDNTFKPDNNATRAEACAMIYKLLENK